MSERLLTTAELCKVFNISRRTFYRWLEEGAVKAHKLPLQGHWRIPLSEVNRLRQEMGLAPLEE